MDHMKSSSSVINSATNEDFKKDEFTNAKSNKFDKDMMPIDQCCRNKLINSDDESALLADVKVCDICGDAGREDFLAVCSKCGDGAEHIYCMRSRLDELPDSNWICEECVLSEKEKMTRKSERFVTYGKRKCMDQSYKGDDISKGSGQKVHPRMNGKGLDVIKSRVEKISSLSLADRISSDQTSTLMRKRIAVGTKSGPPSISRDSKVPYSQNFAIKSSDEPSSSRTRNIQESRAFPFRSGNFVKSNSFNSSEKRPKVLRLDAVPQNQFSGETHNRKKVSTMRALRKTVSFNDASSGHPNASSPKCVRIPPKLCEDSDVKRIRNMKEHDSAETTSRFEFNRPQVGLLENGSCFPASFCDKASALLGGTKLADPCGTKYHNAKVVRSTRDTDDAIRSSRCFTSSNASEELTRKGETNNDFSLLKASLCSNTIGEDKVASQKESSIQTEKVPHTLTFSSRSSDFKKQGGENEYVCQSEQAHLTSSASGSVVDGLMKDKSGSSQMDLANTSYHQLTMVAFPKFDYIWKGEFEIRSVRLPRVLYRMQAHLSTQASPRIPEVVKKFSDKILLEEVSRMDAWPIHFQMRYPQEDSIGLYFFAEDVLSYGNYKGLLNSMADHDLALRGNLSGIEIGMASCFCGECLEAERSKAATIPRQQFEFQTNHF